MNSGDDPEDLGEDIPVGGSDTSGHDRAWIEAMNLVGKYLESQSDDIREDTELNQGERLLISLMEGMADNPFPHWQPDNTQISSPSLQRFIELYDKRGKSLNRGSRKETVDIFNGIFQGLKDSRRKEGGGSSLIDGVLR